MVLHVGVQTTNKLVVCNGVYLEFQLTVKYDENRSIGDILRVTDILSPDRCVTVQLISLQPLRSEKNGVPVVQLPVIWAKSDVIADKRLHSSGRF
jgi:hypothetical protein